MILWCFVVLNATSELIQTFSLMLPLWYSAGSQYLCCDTLWYPGYFCCIWFDTNPHSAAAACLLWYFVILLWYFWYSAVIIFCCVCDTLCCIGFDTNPHSAAGSAAVDTLWCCCDILHNISAVIFCWLTISMRWYFVILFSCICDTFDTCDTMVLCYTLWCISFDTNPHSAAAVILLILFSSQYICCDTHGT